MAHARAYDIVANLAFAGRRRRAYAELVARAGCGPGDRVLDVGCGPGYFTAMAAEAVRPGGAAVGLDTSPAMIDYARRIRGQASCSFQLGLAESIEEPDGSFDVVLSSLMIHHIPEELRPQVVREMARVLRQGGRILVADFSPPSGRLGRLVTGALAGHGMRDNPIHQLAGLVRDAGFEDTSTGDVRPFLHYVLGHKRR